MIIWYRSDNALPNKAFVTLIPSVNETTSVLTIPNVISEDVGTYFCEAWANNGGVRSMAVNLFLAGKTFE